METKNKKSKEIKKVKAKIFLILKVPIAISLNPFLSQHFVSSISLILPLLANNLLA